ncbi:MAG TPA: FtsK/SpoIIIE domain-containing protein, partial [Caldilineaceae bacterium]|nr:FtsK/SpoIIIE domain-containing protein [Caldilineaceae bacterium]
MAITQEIARKTLFTSGARKNRHNFFKSLTTDALGFGWSVLNSEYKHIYTVHKAIPSACMSLSEAFITLLDSLLRSKDRLARGFDKKLFDLVDAQLRKHLSNDVSTPKFYGMKRGSYETPISWVIKVNFQEVDVTKLSAIETTLEEILSRNGYAGNVMVHYRPLRVEISKPTDSLPVFLLSDIWDKLNQFPTNQGIAVPAMCFDTGKSDLYDVKLVNENRSIFIVGKPGSGKSQIALSLLLSLCYLNNPNSLSMVICDPKADDYLPLSNLTHLAMPVITEPERLLETLEKLVNEMDSRRDRGLKGDRSYKQHLIAVYVDELADIQASLKGEEKQRFITAWQRLAQRGRSAGIIVIGSTQRPYDLEGSLYANLNLKFVGALNSPAESAAIAGKGVITSKLSPGSFEVYPKGDAIRGLFVADAD